MHSRALSQIFWYSAPSHGPDRCESKRQRLEMHARAARRVGSAQTEGRLHEDKYLSSCRGSGKDMIGMVDVAEAPNRPQLVSWLMEWDLVNRTENAILPNEF